MEAQFLIQAIESDLSVSNVPSKEALRRAPPLKSFQATKLPRPLYSSGKRIA